MRNRRVWLALLVTLALGIASRGVRVGWAVWDSALGDALYAVAVYLVVVLTTRRRAFPDAFAAALLVCLAIELFKLTGIPRALSHLPLVRWIFGTTFAAHNLARYFLGVAAITAIDRLWLRRR